MLCREYSKEEKIAYVDEFKSSGMNITEFARSKNIPATTLRGWLRLERALSFGEIDLRPKSQISPSAPIIKKTMVFAKDDIRIELKEGFDKKLLRDLVEVLINAGWLIK